MLLSALDRYLLPCLVCGYLLSNVHLKVERSGIGVILEGRFKEVNLNSSSLISLREQWMRPEAISLSTRRQSEGRRQSEYIGAHQRFRERF